jgi:uncharacterized delta-60 repeat protein
MRPAFRSAFPLCTPAPILALAVTLAAALAPTPPPAAAVTLETAPGRVVFPVAGGRARLAGAVSIPGGALLVGVLERSGKVYVAKVSATGVPATSFGSGGVARVDAELAFEQVLVEPDGRILLVGMRSRLGHFSELRWGEAHGSLVVVRLNPDGSIDRSYGENGTAATTLQGGCYCSAIAFEPPGGGLLLTGQRALTTRTRNETIETYNWAVARLTAAGTLEAGFGRDGVAIVPGEDGVGLSIAASANGTIITQGQASVTNDGATGPQNLMTRLTAAGAPDRSFAGGVPFQLPVYSIDDSYGQVPAPLEAVAEPDGRVVIETFPVAANPGEARTNYGVGLLAYNSAGAADTTFGYGGSLNLEEGREPTGSELVPLPEGELLAVHRRGSTKPSDNAQAVPGVVEFERITAAGRLDESFAKPPGLSLAVPFGGGLGEPSPQSPYSYPEAKFTLAQNSFLAAQSSPQTLAQPDGSFLLAGDVSLVAATERHVPERSVIRFALAALTPSMTLDAAVGAPAQAPSLALSGIGQRAGDDLQRRRILISAESSVPGLARIELFSGRRLLGHRLVALLSSGKTRFAIPLSRAGLRYLRAHPHARLRAAGAFRDVLADSAAASSGFTLR